MQKSLHIDPSKCTGCLQCEMACSYENYGAFNISKSRIKVFNFEHEGRKALLAVGFDITDQLRAGDRQGAEMRPLRRRPRLRRGLSHRRHHLRRCRMDRARQDAPVGRQDQHSIARQRLRRQTWDGHEKSCALT